MDCWERWNIISCIISVLKKIDNESVPLLACILLTFVEINLKNRYSCRVETFCYSGVLLNVYFESLEQWGWVDQVRCFFFFFFPFFNHSENNMTYSEASWREKKCSVNCIKLNFFFLSPFLPFFSLQSLQKVLVEFSHKELFDFYNKVCIFFNNFLYGGFSQCFLYFMNSYF